MFDGVNCTGGPKARPNLGGSAKIGAPFWKNIHHLSKNLCIDYRVIPNKPLLEYIISLSGSYCKILVPDWLIISLVTENEITSYD